MVDVFDLEIRYAPQLEVAKKHLSSKENNAGRSQLGPNKIQHLYDNNADCPICGTVFEGGNHNTEHIFPIALGGKNTMDNKIQLCVMCNNSRNQVMQAIIGNSPRSKYPNNWIQIKQTLLWHFITIDDGIKAGELIQTPHQKFMQYRTGGEPLPNRPKNAFGRFSTWKIGDPPNYIGNKHSPITKFRENPPEQFSWRLVGRNILDKFFGYEPKDKPPLDEKIQGDSGAPNFTKKESQPRKNSPTDKISKATPEGSNPSEFVKAVIKLIPNDEVSVTSLAQEIRKMQESEGWAELGTRSFLQHYGFPRNFGLLNALDSCFGDRIAVSGDHTDRRIRIGDQIEQPEEFPLIPKFNTAVKGLKLPRHPKQYAECVQAYFSNQEKITTSTEAFQLFYPILGGKRRAETLVLRFSFVFFQDDETHIKEKDWTLAKYMQDPVLISESVRENMIEHFPDFIEHINSYFDKVNIELQKQNPEDVS